MASSNEETKFSHWNFSEVLITNVHLYKKDSFLLVTFCSTLILITTLLLYALWVHRHRRESSTTANNAIIISPPARSLGLDPTVINSLPIILYRSNRVTNNSKMSNDSPSVSVVVDTECSICLCVFEDEEKLKALPKCQHAYHSDCLDKWLNAHSSCPLCRASLDQ